MRHGQIDAAWRGRVECRNCGIRELVLFADLHEQDFALIHLPIEEIRFEPSAALFHVGDDGDAVFTIRDGLLKLVQYLPDGTQRIVRLVGPGAVVGLEVLAGQPYQHTAVALQPALVCRIRQQVVDRLNRETPRLYRQLMAKWHASVNLADECLTELNTGTARQRMARLFLHLLADDPDGSCRFLRREDVGALLSVTTETACRVVADFKRAGLVREEGDNLFRCDRGGLRAAALGERSAD